MAIKSFKPFTKSRRFTTVLDYSELSDVAPEKSLTVGLKKTGGRNNMGRVTTRFRGGGNKRIYRKVDFKRNKFDVTAEVKTIEYDPNRSAFIALIEYADGVKSYILATNGMKVGQIVSNGPNAEIKAGNAMPLRSIPVGTEVHNIEFIPGRGGKMVRAAGLDMTDFLSTVIEN